MMGNPISELRSVTCHMRSHTVTCRPTPDINPQPSRPVLDLPTPEGWKAELTLEVGSMPRWFTCPLTVTHPGTN